MRIAGLQPTAATATMPLVAGVARLAASPAPVDDSQMLSFDGTLGPERRQTATDALWFVPAEDRALLRGAGVRIHILDTDRVPEDPAAPSGVDGPIVGATAIAAQGPDGPWAPRMIRVAARPVDGTSMYEVLLHEVGHAVSVLRRQDSSEQAADEYLAERMGEAASGIGPDGGVRLEAPHRPHRVPAPGGVADVATAVSRSSDGGGSGWFGAAALAVLGAALLLL